MAASVAAPKRLEGEKAQRIIEAMRTSVGTRGAAGSTFDHVAREAGVSRGLLHYYFGSKEQLLVEVVRHDCEVRIAGMGARIARATTADEIIAALVLGLEEFIEGEPGSPAVIYELLSASRHSEDIRAELAELYRRWRADLADSLRDKEREGVVRLDADPESVASMLFALGDGFGIQVLSDPEWDRDARLRVGVRIARRLLGAAGLAAPWSACRTGSAGRPRCCAPRAARDPDLDRRARRPTTGPASRSGASARRCGACARIRRAALLVMGEGIAFTAYGEAAVVAEELEAADTVVAVELRVERVQDHLADGRTEMVDGARWRWTDEQLAESEPRILAELERL